MQQTNQITISPNVNRDLYTVVQQQVELGAQALKQGQANVALTLFLSARKKLTVGQPFYDHLVHNLLLSYKLLIEHSLSSGDEAAVNEILRTAINLEICGEMSTDLKFKQVFADGFQALGLTLFKNGLYEASVSCLRKAISISAAPGVYVNLSNSLTASGQPAVLSDYMTDMALDEQGRHIFIACVPKSASTFLKDLLVSLTGYRDAFLVYAAGQNEHEIYLPVLRKCAPFDTVTQQHCRASDANIQLMQAFGIRPIVLVRNIFDSVISLLDFYDKGAFYNSYFREDFYTLDAETKVDLLIDNLIPWYFQFVASWSLVEKQKRLDIKWLSYEDMVTDKPSAIQNVLRFYGLGASLRNVEQKIRQVESSQISIRFNKGVSGRGEKGLSHRQKERIRRLARYYPSTDFSRIGL